MRPCPSRLLSPLLVAVCAALLALPAQAQDRRGRGEARESPRVERAPSPEVRTAVARPRSRDAMSDSIRRIRQSTNGQVLSAERIHSGDRTINQIKVMDDRGRVRVYEDEPRRHRSQRSRRDDD